MGYRLFDVIISFLCLVFFSPLFFLIALFIKLESKGPILFMQKRVGKDRCVYNIYKFRSMYQHHHTPEELGPIKHDHQLVTRVGYVLRRFKLDEIPQFLNVLFGDMSVVGPRPCLFSKLDCMTAREKKRFSVLPGMTSWAEINGNVELDWYEQLLLDLWYVDHKTIWLDISILWKTILIVLFGSVKNQAAIRQAAHYLYESEDTKHL